MFFNTNINRNHSLFSKRSSDGHYRRFTQNPTNFKISNSKTIFDACQTDRSESQANQTSNNLLGYSQDIIESPRANQFHIKTYIRFKPTKNFPFSQLNQNNSSEMKKIAVIDKKKILCEDNFFSYDHVFEQNSTQIDIYNCSCKQMVEHFVRGFNSTIFAYGQTGSGKTYTMFGDLQDQNNKGMIPHIIRDIFALINNNTGSINNNQKSETIISCSMLEIYKQSMIDLLSMQKLELKIKEHQIFNVANLNIKQVNNEFQMYQVLKTGNEWKKIRETNMNESSSRSHVIFTIYLEVKKQNQRRLSKFNLVDLAGSEKVSKSKVQGEGLQQAKKINLSLSCLGNTINALLKGNDHIPYRQSKLTRLLYESLGGNSLTKLIVTCSSEDSEIEQTLSSLKFASRAKNLKTNPLINTLRKSQKSVSRIAFQNIKTNLHKAQNKLRKIQIIVDELQSHLKENEKQFNQQNKQNLNNHLNKQNNKNQSCSQLSEYRIFIVKVKNILSTLNKDKKEQNIERRQKDEYRTTQTLLNPFLMITESEQKGIKNENDNKIKLISENKKSISNIYDSVFNQKEYQKYWDIIKQQEKQIQTLKKQIKLSESKYDIQTIKKEKKLLIQNSSSTMNSILIQSQNQNNQKQNKSDKQNIQIKDAKQKKVINIKLTSNKGLPIKQIYLNSPNQKIDGIVKNSAQMNSKILSRKTSESNIFTRTIQSPRQFNAIQLPKNENQIQNLLKQIQRKLNHRNQYDKFQKRILIKQIELLLNEISNESENQQQFLDQKNILNQQTNQLLLFQSKYIDQLQTALAKLRKSSLLHPQITNDGEEIKLKLKIDAIKFR